MMTTTLTGSRPAAVPTGSRPAALPTMVRAEVYKLVHHRTPWAILSGLLALTLIAPVYYLFRQPASNLDYLDTTLGVLTLTTALLVPVFGAWVIGHEYRQGTLRRVVAMNGRRNELLAIKGLLAILGSIAGVLVATATGMGMAAIAAQVHGDQIVTTGLWRLTASSLFVAVVLAALSYLASVILRSDTYAMLGTIGVMSAFGQLLALVPRVGDYMPPVAMATITDWISDPSIQVADGLLWKSALSLGLTIVVPLIAARQLFAVRDL